MSGSGGAGPGSEVDQLPLFSFFVTSYEAMQRLSGSQLGFGGDLRFGEADGLAGADKICAEIAEYSMPGAGQKQWRALLSATTGGPSGGPVHAIDRVGSGPWYDRLGRLLAQGVAGLQSYRPEGADPTIVNDLPNEYGVPNHAPEGESVDNHHTLTGSDEQGRLYEDNPRITCQDWTSAMGSDGEPRVGMSWPRDTSSGLRPARGTGDHWISSRTEAGCAPGVNLVAGVEESDSKSVGAGGGYGGIYCFALMP